MRTVGSLLIVLILASLFARFAPAPTSPEPTRIALGEYCCTWVFIQDVTFVLADSGGTHIFDRGRATRISDGWILHGKDGLRRLRQEGDGFGLDAPGKYLEPVELDEVTFDQAFHGRLKRSLRLEKLKPRTDPETAPGT